MTNSLVGDVYLKIIEEVVRASTNDFEESGVGQATLGELQQEWQVKLSQRAVAQMPWDPKPEPPRMNPQQLPTPNGISPAYPGYDNQSPSMGNGRPIKIEDGVDTPYQHLPPQNTYPGPQQGGAIRAAQLVEQQFGSQAAAALQPRTGLALPGQPPKQGLQLPGQPSQQDQYARQQMLQRQQQALQEQQANPAIKIEQDTQYSPQQGTAFAQTDGADDAEEWRAMLEQRRAMHSATIVANDRFMRDRIEALSYELESGLMIPFDAQRVARRQKVQLAQSLANASSKATTSRIPQLDGDVDDDETPKGSRADEDDEDAINSDLDDSDDDQNPIGDDDDDNGDTILCTYDKVQRVKNKWKCVLKDGVLNTGGKEWLFHKGNGEFEW